MERKMGSTMVLIGGILETILAVTSIAVLALYLSESSPELFAQLNITPTEGVLAMFSLYAVTALHVISAVIALAFHKKPNKYRPIQWTGMLLMILVFVNASLTSDNFIRNIITLLPGALLIGGAASLKRSLKS